MTKKFNQFAIQVLAKYANENNLISIRSLDDLSSLEEWLIMLLYKSENQSVLSKLLDETDLNKTVCPKCGSTDIITSIYCNKCNTTY